MATKLDPVQERIFLAISKLLDDYKPSDTDLCAWMKVTPQMLSDYRACRRILTPRMMKALAEHLRTSHPVAGEIVSAAGDEIVRRPEVEGLTDALAAATDAVVLLGDYTREARDAADPQSPGGTTYTPAERARLRERLAPLRRLLADADRALEAPALRGVG